MDRKLIVFLSGISVAGSLNACSDDSSPTTPNLNPVSWDAGHVLLEADDFYIDINGVRYLADDENLVVDGDPGNATYQSLELTWQERGVEMRLYIYLQATSTEWSSDEVRTYDGSGGGDGTRWVYFYGEHFKSPIGNGFTGDVDLLSSDSDNVGVEGKVHFGNLRLLAF